MIKQNGHWWGLCDCGSEALRCWENYSLCPCWEVSMVFSELHAQHYFLLQTMV